MWKSQPNYPNSDKWDLIIDELIYRIVHLFAVDGWFGPVLVAVFILSLIVLMSGFVVGFDSLQNTLELLALFWVSLIVLVAAFSLIIAIMRLSEYMRSRSVAKGVARIITSLLYIVIGSALFWAF